MFGLRPREQYNYARVVGSLFAKIMSFSPGQVVIHGTTEATDHLVDFAKKNLGIAGDKIFAPKIGECVDASTQSLLYQVNAPCVWYGGQCVVLVLLSICPCV